MNKWQALYLLGGLGQAVWCIWMCWSAKRQYPSLRMGPAIRAMVRREMEEKLDRRDMDMARQIVRENEEAKGRMSA